MLGGSDHKCIIEGGIKSVRMFHQPDCSGFWWHKNQHPKCHANTTRDAPLPPCTSQAPPVMATAAAVFPDCTFIPFAGTTVRTEDSAMSSSSDEDSDVWTAAHLGSSSSSDVRSSSPSQQQLLQQVVRDPPAADKLHTAPHPGVWRLREQQLALDAAGQLGPLMLVSGAGGGKGERGVGGCKRLGFVTLEVEGLGV